MCIYFYFFSPQQRQSYTHILSMMRPSGVCVCYALGPFSPFTGFVGFSSWMDGLEGERTVSVKKEEEEEEESLCALSYAMV